MGLFVAVGARVEWCLHKDETASLTPCNVLARQRTWLTIVSIAANLSEEHQLQCILFDLIGDIAS